MDELELIINGTKYAGWLSSRLHRSMEELAPTFSVSFTEQWLRDKAAIPINEGDAAEIRLGGDVTLNGWVDFDGIAYDEKSHNLRVTGRAATGDLVDCAAIYKGGRWKGVDIYAIANDLCEPFGIEVVSSGNLGDVFKKAFVLQIGETVHEALERAAKMRALLLMTHADGSLFITRVGTRKTKTVLTRGVNILTGARETSGVGRFSEYIGKAQIPGDDEQSGDATTITRTVKDPHVARYRPTIIMAETEDTGKELKDRLTWECNRRAGEARRLSYVVPGWRDEDDRLWDPNTLVDVQDPVLRVGGEWLIVSVTNQYNDSGKVAELVLTRKEAFDLIEFPAPSGKTAGEDYQ